MNAFEQRTTFCLSLVSGTRMLGLFMLLPVLPVYATSLTGATPFLIGLALGIYGLPQALLQIPAGGLSDRIGRKPVIIAGLCIFALGTLIAALSHTITGVIIGRFFQGAGAIASATIALLTDLTTERYRTRSMAIFGMSIGCAFCLAMVAGPLIASTFGPSAIFWLTLICCAISISIIYFAVPTPLTQTMDRHHLCRLSDLKAIITNRKMLPLLVGVFILHFTLMGLFMSFPILLETKAHIPLKYHGWLYLGILVFSFCAMVPFIILSEKKHCLKQCMLGAVTLLVVASLWLTFTPHRITLLIIGAFLYFTAFNFLEACLPSMLSKMSAPGMKGTTLGVYSSCQFLGAGSGGALSGFVIQIAGYQSMMIMCCLFAAFWWIISFTVRQPPKTRSIVLTIYPTMEAHIRLVEQQLASIPGVTDVSMFDDERMAYLKVDPTLLDKKRLNHFGEWPQG